MNSNKLYYNHFLDQRGRVLSVNNPSYVITTQQTPSVTIDPGYVVSNQQYIQQGPMYNPPNYNQVAPNYSKYDIYYGQPEATYQQNTQNRY